MTTESRKLDPLDIHIGARLRALREQERITQAQLAGAIGVTFQQVQKYEAGTNRISAARLGRAAEALACRVADFYPDPDDAPTDTERKAALIALYDALNARQREALVVMAQALAGLQR